MAKPKFPNQKRAYSLLEQRTMRYLQLIKQIFATHNSEAASIVSMLDHDQNTPFSFADYPQTQAAVRNMLAGFAGDMRATIVGGVSTEWQNAIATSEKLAAIFGKRLGLGDVGNLLENGFNNTDTALEAFKKRVVGGMNLSQRVWNLTENYQTELEAALSLAMENGTSAVTLSKRISKYLHDFPNLQKEYTERFGTAPKIQNCEYHSARLARTEINMAYRNAEQEQWRATDYVLGYEIKRAARRKNFDCKVCEALVGKYPKDFVFNGFHPMCRCYVIPILKTEDEFFNDTPTDKCSGYVSDVPNDFKDWVENNKERIENAKSLPYFLQDNTKLWKDIVPQRHEQLVKEKMLFAKKQLANFQNQVLSVAQKFNSTVSDVNLKSFDSTIRKINAENCNIGDIRDLLRTTIISESEQALPNILNEIEKTFSIATDSMGIKRIKSQQTILGYTGTLVNVQMRGINAEIQINTPQMIYAKDIYAKNILPKNVFDKIKRESGLECGLGHTYYEEWRLLGINEKMRKLGLEKLSKDYFNKIRKVIL